MRGLVPIGRGEGNSFCQTIRKRQSAAGELGSASTFVLRSLTLAARHLLRWPELFFCRLEVAAATATEISASAKVAASAKVSTTSEVAASAGVSAAA